MIRRSILVLSVLLLSLVAATGVVTAANDAETYSDDALGLSFVAPRGLNFIQATRTDYEFIGQTTTARLSSYPLLTEKRPSDFRGEILIEFSTFARDAATLDQLAAKRMSPQGLVTSSRRSVAGRETLLLGGTFANGPREFAIVALDAQRVLVIQAFPSYSTRIGVFHQVITQMCQ